LNGWETHSIVNPSAVIALNWLATLKTPDNNSSQLIKMNESRAVSRESDLALIAHYQ
jgi:hypothetical protein